MYLFRGVLHFCCYYERHFLLLNFPPDYYLCIFTLHEEAILKFFFLILIIFEIIFMKIHIKYLLVFEKEK